MHVFFSLPLLPSLSSIFCLSPFSSTHILFSHTCLLFSSFPFLSFISVPLCSLSSSILPSFNPHQPPSISLDLSSLPSLHPCSFFPHPSLLFLPPPSLLLCCISSSPPVHSSALVLLFTISLLSSPIFTCPSSGLCPVSSIFFLLITSSPFLGKYIQLFAFEQDGEER